MLWLRREYGASMKLLQPILAGATVRDRMIACVGALPGIGEPLDISRSDLKAVVKLAFENAAARGR